MQVFRGENMEETFEKRMIMLLGDEYADFKNSLALKPVKGFYLNLNKKDAINHLNHKYIQPIPTLDYGYYFDYDNYPLGKSAFFNCGLYYIQEPSAMQVANYLDINANDYVLDMCGAPGGKSCHIGNLLSNDGLLISNDVNPLRARILSENVERFGLTNTIVTNTDPQNFLNNFKGFFDKIILDAPCSGEGMFRKTNNAITTWSLTKIKDCSLIQNNLLHTAFQLLKPGGYLLYATCTYSLEENENQITKALNDYDFTLVPLALKEGMSPGYQMPGVIRLYPHKHQGEGQFIALLRKNGLPENKKYPLLKPNINSLQKKLLSKFYQDNLTIAIPPNIYESNNHLYAIQKHFPNLKGIKILRNGLYLGECKKNRFEPSLSLALSLTASQAKNTYNYAENSPEIKKYLRGEPLVGNNKKGYGLILVEGYPLSFYKESNNQIKNLYPKGLRR